MARQFLYINVKDVDSISLLGLLQAVSW